MPDSTIDSAINDSTTNTTKNTSVLGVYGGTFDPIHNAHIIPVQQAAKELGINNITLIPCHIPPHKESPITKPSHRLAMAKLVSHHIPLFNIDDRELKRHKASYTIDTVQELRKAHPQQSICFLLAWIP